MVNESDLDWTEHEGAETASRRKKLAAAAGGEEVGASLYEVDPGERPWPLHYHTGNEEALYVLAGEGVLRRGEGYDDVPLSPGEYVACPADESGAHQVVNRGEEVLRYLMVSTMNEPDVAVYPEADGIGVFVGAPPGGDGERTVSGFWNRGDAVEYWD
ncbi:cupin domain-containing protein [Halosegnis marinus]|uniref:Cupin domain-containing protein n=1 Tax=Halosegnis marinus TaxID=3034023 RepID=A0ABD5ZN12_9EURY|nr:cupin domain-containing protein [Halosegnis sp. DT85]